MPTYEYRCTDCDQRLEVVQAFSDDPLTECPHCRGRLKKVFSTPGIAFKGSGFYKTDSRSSGSTGSSGSSSDSPSTSSASTSNTNGGDSAGSSSKTEAATA